MANIGVVSSITRMGTIEPFELQVSRGQITYHETFCQFGINNNVGQANETIWIGSSLYSFPTSASVLKVSSSSASDAYPSGTGAQTVLIDGLNAAYERVSEVVELNGQTAVNTANSYLRVNKMIVLTAGSGGTSAGFIYAGTGTVNAGVPDVIVNQTGLTANETESGFYSVPAGYTAYINMWTMSSGNITPDEWTRFTLRVRPFGGVFGIKAQYYIQGSGIYECKAAYPIAIPEKADIDIWGYASDGTASVTSQLQIILVKNNYEV
jgi:hypothetical protein